MRRSVILVLLVGLALFAFLVPVVPLGTVTSCEFYCGAGCFCPAALPPLGQLYSSVSFAVAQVGVVVLAGNGSLTIAFPCQNALCPAL